MRWIKYGVLATLLLLGIYAVSMYYLVDESESFTMEKEVGYPVEKVFPQFSNLQNFARWYGYFNKNKDSKIQFYEPYEGQGAAMGFSDPESGRNADLFLRYANKNSTLKYQLYEGKNTSPTLINIKFTPVGDNRTKLKWFVHTPKKSLLMRSSNFFSGSDFIEGLDASLAKLTAVLGNKVDKDAQLASIKYDSLMTESSEGQLLLGVNVSASNKRDALFKNIVLNHNKVLNFISVDLHKAEDEFGLPVLITDPSNLKQSEISYFYGVALPARVAVADNNFTFRTVNPSQNLVMYYQGSYEGRAKAVQQLLQKAKKDTLRNGELQQIFLEPPVDGKAVKLKLALPVFR